MKHAALLLAVVLGAGAGVPYLVKSDTKAEPMPLPSPVMPKPSVPSKEGVVHGASFEVVENGRVKVVVTSRNGVPIIIVDDNGTARVVDLAKVARMLR